MYFLVEAMVDAGILLGMPRATALEMVKQAVFGAATMLRDSGEHPVILREAVTSPGGTTINAIRELERHGVRAAFLAAIEAARDRGRELAMASGSAFRRRLCAAGCAGHGILAVTPQLAYGVARQSVSSELSMLVRVALFRTGLTLEAGVTGALKPR